MTRIKEFCTTDAANAWLVEWGDSIVVEQVTIVQVPYPPFKEAIIVYTPKDIAKK